MIYFFFKEKTAYEMRIGELSSDVCASDLPGGRRHPVAERGPAPTIGLVRLPSPDPVFQGRGVAREGTRKNQYGHLPRKFGRYLCRYRVRSRERRGQEVDCLFAKRTGRQENSFPRYVRHRRQARVQRGHEAPGAQGHPVRHRQRSEEHTSELQSLMRISYAVFCLKK